MSKVAKAAIAATRQRAAFEEAIRDASAAGESTRKIAEAAGLSHQRVWQIIRGH